MVWENVKDGVSRPIGSQEIQKTKVETDLLDTLYIVSDIRQRYISQIISTSYCTNIVLSYFPYPTE